jgi:ABC-type transport system involved in cytochrome bd biosynthesis fused ATPase/permease subunit
MIRLRLIRFAEKARKYVFLAVLAQWCGLLANAAILCSAASLIGAMADSVVDVRRLLQTLIIAGTAAAVRAICGTLANKASFLASSGVKGLLRERLFTKLSALGAAYTENLTTAEALQVATEGVDQLETYFGRYLPQFFYCIAAPVTLFAIIMPQCPPAAVLLLICAPLIPLLLILIGKMAGKVMGRQWGSYISLGDRFLENLQGMTTLKVYAADGMKQDEMAQESETFRRSTMRVLRMQLGSIIFMDIIAFGGAALGVLLSARSYMAGNVDFAQALTAALLSAEFFIPLRQLGSYFHVAMTGVAASDRMFRLLDLSEPPDGGAILPDGDLDTEIRDLTFVYPGTFSPALDGLSLTLRRGSLVSLAGTSGCGKSTVAAILSGARRDYAGSVTIGGIPLREISRKNLQSRVTLVTHEAYVFGGTVADNLRLAKPKASDAEMTEALTAACLWAFFAARDGLDTVLTERGANLSGGQRQRLCIARAILRGSDIYIFDEAASNIDAESEQAVMDVMRELAKTKAVLLISHRLENAVPADCIYLMEDGKVMETGCHTELIKRGGAYARLYNEQRELENYGREGTV